MENDAAKASETPRKQLRKRTKKPAVRRPKYCGPHSTGKGFCWRGKQPIYFPGEWDSIESRDAYSAYCKRLLGEVPEVPEPSTVSVTLLLGRFKDDKLPTLPKSQQLHFHSIIRIAAEVYGEDRADTFGPLKLQKLRGILCDQKAGQPRRKKAADLAAKRTKPPKEQRIWSRKYVNAQVRRIIRIFKWGASVELVKDGVWRSMESIEPLKRGESTARETSPVKPVDYAQVQATRKVASPTVAAMIEVHRLTGMRSSNLCDMRACDIDMTTDVWTYVPERHKKQWRELNLFVALGPRVQAILKPFILSRPATAFLFTPHDSAQWQSDKRWADRKTPRWESAAKKRGKVNPRLQPKYNANSYRQAIAYAAALAEVPAWKPHQLRHSRGTEVRKRFKAEAARVSLGHSTLSATEIYAEADMELAREVAREMG